MSAPLFVKEGRRYYAAPSEVIAAAARTLAIEGLTRGMDLTSPRVAKEFVVARYAGLPHELFSMILLDNRHRVIKYLDLFRGTIDGASVHPREVVKEALNANAAAVILAHNHPSGVPEPSQADELITMRLRDALALVDIRVLDHLIVGGDRVTSFAERGLL